MYKNNLIGPILLYDLDSFFSSVIFDLISILSIFGQILNLLDRDPISTICLDY
ncbi:hypothetical protein RJT54_00280 [Buchnera aphidicola (Takecallis taiwana)]|uniref:hypothetical protein n=1 Tax=Buchnera aphidicola TaxID=9 RepID=UPI0031B70410